MWADRVPASGTTSEKPCVVGVHEPLDQMISGDTWCHGRWQQLPHSGAGAIHTEAATIRGRHQGGLTVDMGVSNPVGPGEARDLAGHAIARMRQRRLRQAGPLTVFALRTEMSA
jgi:hypothetical protein